MLSSDKTLRTELYKMPDERGVALIRLSDANNCADCGNYTRYIVIETDNRYRAWCGVCEVGP